MYDDFNVFCINDYYDYLTYKGYAVPVSEIELNSPLRVWVEGPNYMLLLEGTECFLCGTQYMSPCQPNGEVDMILLC